MNKQIEIYSWGGTKKIKSFSPFCMKAIYGSKLKGVEPKIHYVTNNMPKWSNKGTLPVAILHGENIEDSTSILLKLDQHFPDQQLLYPKDEALRLETKLLEDWADEYFSGFSVVARWKVDANFQKFSIDAFSKFPWILKKLVLPTIRKETVSAYAYRTVGAASDQERLALYVEALKIISYRLGAKNFIVTEQITAADLAIFTLIEQAYYVSEIKDMVDAINGFENIISWMNRMKTALH